jgi:hypothetical protein
MIGISTLTIDPSGALLLDEHPDTLINQLERRIQKTATLDGGVDVEDLGFTDADRSTEIVIDSTPALYEQLRYLITNYATVGISSRMGYNTAAIKRVSDLDGKIKVTCELRT